MHPLFAEVYVGVTARGVAAEYAASAVCGATSAVEGGEAVCGAPPAPAGADAVRGVSHNDGLECRDLRSSKRFSCITCLGI
jgi:hypothetical protein